MSKRKRTNNSRPVDDSSEWDSDSESTSDESDDSSSHSESMSDESNDESVEIVLQGKDTISISDCSTADTGDSSDDNADLPMSGAEESSGDDEASTVPDGEPYRVQWEMSLLMSPPMAHPSVVPLLEETCEKVFIKALAAGVIRVPISLSSTSAQLSLEPLPQSDVPIVYVLFTDDTCSKIEKIGMSHKIQGRYTNEILKRCHVLCSSGWITPELDQQFEMLLHEFIDNLMACPHAPDALKALFDIYRRGGDDLGMESNLYVQLIEISCQLYFDQYSPAEAFTRDEQKLWDRREKVLVAANYLMPKLLDRVDGRVTKTHCTCSWATGAPEWLLSSQLTLTDYVSNNAQRQDTLPNPVYPNSGPAHQRFARNFEDDEMADGRKVATDNVERCTEEFRVGFLDTNELIFAKQPLEEQLIQKGFQCLATVDSPTEKGWLIKIFVHQTTGSVIFLHKPLGIGMDSRGFVPLESSLTRLEGAELMRLLLKGLETGQESFAMGDLPQHDAIFAGYVLESATRYFHQNKRLGCAAARDVLTDESINALVQNALKKRNGEIQGICRNARAKHRRVDPNVARAVERYVIVRAINLLSFHGLDPELSEGFEISQDLIDRQSLKSICTMIDERFSDDTDPRAKSARWNCFVQKIVTKELEDQVQAIRNDGLKKTVGNHLPPPAFDVEENDDVLAEFYGGKPFFMRAGTPADEDEAASIPDFGEIETGLGGDLSKVTDFITTLLSEGVEERLKNRKYKNQGQKTSHKRAKAPPSAALRPVRLLKVFVDLGGAVLKQGHPRGLKNCSIDPVPVGRIWYLCRILPLEKK